MAYARQTIRSYAFSAWHGHSSAGVKQDTKPKYRHPSCRRDRRMTHVSNRVRRISDSQREPGWLPACRQDLAVALMEREIL
jgi:hypothetical protein